MGQDELGKILIADNDEDVLLALEQALENEGYETAVTVSGEVAFQILATGAFDLLVLDDYLSDRHCIQVAHPLSARRNEAHGGCYLPSTPVSRQA